jgi:nucleotide-binding universal stress UspA family protein
MDARITYEHIACFIDDSDAARGGLTHAVALRALTGGRLSVVHVVASPGYLISLAASVGGGTLPDAALERSAAEMWLTEQVRGLEGAEAVLLEGPPAGTACEWAAGSGCDLLVVATHRGLVERSLLGSFAGHVAHHAPCPVLLIPPGDGPN